MKYILNVFHNFQRGVGLAGLHVFHWLIIFLSLCLTLGTWYFAQLQVEEKNLVKFERESNQVTSLILNRLKKYENVLLSGAAALNAGMDVNDWKDFADELRIEERYPGVNGIGIVLNFKDKDNMKSYINDRREKTQNFKIFPAHEQKEYWPIVHVEPAEFNSKAIGLDLAFESNRRHALFKAKNTGENQITGPIVLVQDSTQTPGFLFYVPHYKKGFPVSNQSEREKAFLNMVYAPFIMKDLINSALNTFERHVTLKITDVTYDEIKNVNILFDEHDSQNLSTDFDSVPQLTKQLDIPFYGRVWRFEIHTGKSFRLATEQNTPLFILIAAIVIETLLIALLLSLSRNNQRSKLLAHDSQSFSDLIMENNPDAIFVKDNNFCIKQANDAFLNFYPENERANIIGKTTVENYHPDDVEIFLKKDREAFKNGYSETIEIIRLPAGDTRTFHTCKTRFYNANKEPFILGICRDVTEREKLIGNLTDSNIELERFAYVASHDLQEPLRMISSFSQILLEDCVENLTEEDKKHFQFITEGAERMQLLIDSLLDYAKAGAEVDKEVLFDADNELDKVLSNLSDKIEKTSTQINRHKLPEIEGQPIHFARVLENLIHNGIKYQPQSKNHVPQISISYTEDDNEWLFKVKDNGIGMDKKYWAKIFDPFQRLHSRKAYEGTGIGLTLCKKIVEKGGGKIHLNSTVNKGTTFYFTVKKIKKGIN